MGAYCELWTKWADAYAHARARATWRRCRQKLLRDIDGTWAISDNL
jgi:hypothetical protein